LFKEVVMSSIALTIELPQDILDEARRAGLLTSQALAELLAAEIRRRQVDRLFAMADQLASLDIPPLSEAEIAAEVQSARLDKQARHARGH
jgi:hypothetical protein